MKFRIEQDPNYSGYFSYDFDGHNLGYSFTWWGAKFVCYRAWYRGKLSKSKWFDYEIKD